MFRVDKQLTRSAQKVSASVSLLQDQGRKRGRSPAVFSASSGTVFVSFIEFVLCFVVMCCVSVMRVEQAT
jgi:hypothetical protein